MIEIRDVSENYWQASGWATTWATRGHPYFVADPAMGTFLEQVERGAFADAAAGREPVELRREHDQTGPVFARTTDGTLAFDDQDPGLLLAGALSKSDPDTQLAVSDIRAGRLAGLSVGMRVEADEWGVAADNRTSLRTITRASLSEVSLVQRPANQQAQITSVRHETRSADGVEYRCVDLRVIDTERSKYTAAEIVELGKAGKAFRHPIGSYAFPIVDEQDLLNAIRAVAGRATKSPPAAVRRYIIRRARQLRLSSRIPSTWASDGTSKGSSRSTTTIPHRYSSAAIVEMQLELERHAVAGSRLTRAARGPTSRDRAEQDWTRHRASREMENYLQRRFMPRGIPE